METKQHPIQSSAQLSGCICRLEWRNKESSIFSYRLQYTHPSLKLTVRCGLCAPQVEYHYSKPLCAILTPSRRRTLQEPSHYGLSQIKLALAAPCSGENGSCDSFPRGDSVDFDSLCKSHSFTSEEQSKTTRLTRPCMDLS